MDTTAEKDVSCDSCLVLMSSLGIKARTKTTPLYRMPRDFGRVFLSGIWIVEEQQELILY